MPRRIVVATVLLASAVLATVRASAGQTLSLADLLNLAGVYLADYANQVSGVTLEEQYQLINVTGGTMRPPVRIASDVVFVNANGGVAALRDIYSIDTRPTRERTPRITALLTSPTASITDWQKAAAFPQQNAVYFMLDIVVKVNEPTTALRFIALNAQRDLKYKLDGKKKMNGVEAIGIGFEEPTERDRKYMLGTRRNGRAMGRIWVDPKTGAIHQTELWVESKGETASVTVKYAPHASLNLLLPTETNETYEERELAAAVSGSAGSGLASQYSFQASAKYSGASYSKIDLRKLR